MLVTDGLMDSLENNNKIQVWKQEYKKLTTTKMKRKKDDYIRVKSKCEKTKKDVENGLVYGNGNMADLIRNMLNNVKNKDVSGALKQLAMEFLPANAHDVADVLLEKLCRRGGRLMSTDGVVDLLGTEHFCVLSQANGNN
eukprot:11964202-Ditylum_brightwellii.AAC.1